MTPLPEKQERLTIFCQTIISEQKCRKPFVAPAASRAVAEQQRRPQHQRQQQHHGLLKDRHRCHGRAGNDSGLSLNRTDSGLFHYSRVRFKLRLFG